MVSPIQRVVRSVVIEIETDDQIVFMLDLAIRISPTTTPPIKGLDPFGSVGTAMDCAIGFKVPASTA